LKEEDGVFKAEFRKCKGKLVDLRKEENELKKQGVPFQKKKIKRTISSASSAYTDNYRTGIWKALKTYQDEIGDPQLNGHKVTNTINPETGKVAKAVFIPFHKSGTWEGRVGNHSEVRDNRIAADDTNLLRDNQLGEMKSALQAKLATPAVDSGMTTKELEAKLDADEKNVGVADDDDSKTVNTEVTAVAKKNDDEEEDSEDEEKAFLDKAMGESAVAAAEHLFAVSSKSKAAAGTKRKISKVDKENKGNAAGTQEVTPTPTVTPPVLELPTNPISGRVIRRRMDEPPTSTVASPATVASLFLRPESSGQVTGAVPAAAPDSPREVLPAESGWSPKNLDSMIADKSLGPRDIYKVKSEFDKLWDVLSKILTTPNRVKDQQLADHWKTYGQTVGNH